MFLHLLFRLAWVARALSAGRDDGARVGALAGPWKFSWRLRVRARAGEAEAARGEAAGLSPVRFRPVAATARVRRYGTIHATEERDALDC